MYVELSRAITEIVRFTNEHRIDAEFHIHTAGQLQGANGTPDAYWARFEKRPGVYVIFDVRKMDVHYVGKSEQDTGSRLYEWMYMDNKVSDAVDKEDLVLSVVLEKQPYMSPALESYLIGKLSPTLNVRGNR